MKPSRVEEAARCLREGGTLVDLMEAVNVLRSDPTAPPSYLLAGLRHAEVVREQAMFALYERTGIPLPEDASGFMRTEEAWSDALARQTATRRPQRKPATWATPGKLAPHDPGGPEQR